MVCVESKEEVWVDWLADESRTEKKQNTKHQRQGGPREPSKGDEELEVMCMKSGYLRPVMVIDWLLGKCGF